MNRRFSVLMSIYIKEKPEYARACFDSLLSQTLPASEWVIVEDGPLSPELYSLLDEYDHANPGLIKRVPLETNHGLGLALREGMLHCSYELVARMDTDDICRNDRFEKQIAEFEKDCDLDICGSHIWEFETTPDHIVCQRSVPLKDAEIKKYQKRRDAFNHVSVMFRKDAVLKAGNYQSCMLMEDTYLWVNMFLSGAKGCNVDESLVFVRIGSDMFERRGGIDYYRKYKEGRKKVFKTGFISYWDYIYTLIVQLFVCLIPNKLRGFIFKNILHR